MIRYLLFSILLFVAMLLSAQTNVITIRMENNVVTRIGVEKLQKITFDETTLHLHLKTGEVNGIALAGIRFFNFESVTGLNSTVSNAPNWTVFPGHTKDQLSFSSLPAGTHQVTVVSVSGQVVHQQRIESAADVLRLNHLQAGIYLVRINNKSIKFIKE